jgi:hypothetical protein
VSRPGPGDRVDEIVAQNAGPLKRWPAFCIVGSENARRADPQEMSREKMPSDSESDQQPARPVYFCPRCGEKLSFLDGTIVKMDGVLKSHAFTVRTQFFLPARLGHYGAIVAGEVDVKQGSKVEFRCFNPRCNANFTAAYDDDLAEVRMVDVDGQEYVVVFNRIFGNRSTFVVNWRESRLVNSFGEHAGEYLAAFERPLNFFGAV